jgi:hypothetical protein
MQEKSPYLQTRKMHNMGKSDIEIADTLHLHIQTVRRYLRNLPGRESSIPPNTVIHLPKSASRFICSVQKVVKNEVQTD